MRIRAFFISRFRIITSCNVPAHSDGSLVMFTFLTLTTRVCYFMAESRSIKLILYCCRTNLHCQTSRGLMQGINMEKSSQGCYKAIQICFCDSYHNKIIDIQNRLPYSKVVYPAIIVLFSCLMEVNHGAGSRPNYPFR